MSRRALVIVNPRARAGEGALEPALARLRAGGIETMVADCEDRDDLAPLIARHRGAVDLVVVGGGDGTMNAAAPGIVEADVPLGILPLGTANDLARTLAIPNDLDGAARVIAEGRTRRIDLGMVNGKPFFNVASLGLSVELTRSLTSETKRRFGRLGYALAAIRVLVRARPFRAVIIDKEGQSRVLTLQVAVGNGLYYGGGNAIEKSARIDDQRLDLYSLEMRRAWKLALMARSFHSGELGAWSEVRALRGETFEVQTRSRRSVNADGEVITHTPARFTLMPKALSVFAPPETVA